jgi:hypothetical protein
MVTTTRQQQIERDICRYSMLLEKNSKRYETGYKAILERLNNELQTLLKEAK